MRPIALVLAAATSVFAGGMRLHAQRPPVTEYSVKAAYLFNFARFTTWSSAGANDSTPFGVCVLGRDPFGTTLDATVTGERVEGRRVAVRRIARPKDTAGCRVLFVSASEDTAWADVLQTLDGAPILTVSDLPQFAERGGMIQFVSEGNRIRFAVNLPAATRVGLTLSAELLRVAITVKTNPPPGA